MLDGLAAFVDFRIGESKMVLTEKKISFLKNIIILITAGLMLGPISLSAAQTSDGQAPGRVMAQQATKDQRLWNTTDHSKHKAQHPGMLEATNDCLAKGQRCIAHCLVSFQEGDTELADCAAKVHEMQAVCGGFSYLVASNSGYMKDYAAVCKKVCNDCRDECLKHKEHIECKACADACEALVEQIDISLG